MQQAGSVQDRPKPLWLLAEVTYRCPLQCPYCSNPVDFAQHRDELSTDDWIRVLREARELGAAQLGLSGGEPLLRRDLETIIEQARALGYYSNLITSGIGMDERRVAALKNAGLDHIQVSFQASSQSLNDDLAGTRCFEHKLAMARAVKAHDYPMVLNVVIHRQNIDQVDKILDMALELGADYVELANTQYYGWARLNRDHLLPSREQVAHAEATAHAYQERYSDRIKIFFVVADYHSERPKACMGGWGNVFLGVAPDGTALPCQAAGQLPGPSFPNVLEDNLASIWYDSEAFNRFRGFEWMQSPCRTCPEHTEDFGGCRCQAYQLTGDPNATDPACKLSPHHEVIEEAVRRAQGDANPAHPIIFRNAKNSKAWSPS